MDALGTVVTMCADGGSAATGGLGEAGGNLRGPWARACVGGTVGEECSPAERGPVRADAKDTAAAAEGAAALPCRAVAAEQADVTMTEVRDDDRDMQLLALAVTHVLPLTYTRGSGLPTASLSCGLGRPPILGLDPRRAGAFGVPSPPSSRTSVASGTPGRLGSTGREVAMRIRASIRITLSCRSRR